MSIPVWLRIGFAIAFVAVCIGYAIHAQRVVNNNDNAARSSMPSALTFVPGYSIDSPAVLAAERARIADESEVIGVRANGKYRAYLLRAFHGNPRQHVVNDVLDGVPVSVVHCDRNHCTKVVTGAARGAPLPLVFGGWYENQMLVRTGDHAYFQRSLAPIRAAAETFPFAEHAFELTTWKKWKSAHPETEIYLGPEWPADSSNK